MISKKKLAREVLIVYRFGALLAAMLALLWCWNLVMGGIDLWYKQQSKRNRQEAQELLRDMKSKYPDPPVWYMVYDSYESTIDSLGFAEPDVFARVLQDEQAVEDLATQLFAAHGEWYNKARDPLGLELDLIEAAAQYELAAEHLTRFDSNEDLYTLEPCAFEWQVDRDGGSIRLLNNDRETCYLTISPSHLAIGMRKDRHLASSMFTRYLIPIENANEESRAYRKRHIDFYHQKLDSEVLWLIWAVAAGLALVIVYPMRLLVTLYRWARKTAEQ